VKTCYQLQYTDLKRLDPDSQAIKTAANTATPPVKRNGLSEEKCEFSGEGKKKVPGFFRLQISSTLSL
jgi:hypothetical protein